MILLQEQESAQDALKIVNAWAVLIATLHHRSALLALIAINAIQTIAIQAFAYHAIHIVNALLCNVQMEFVHLVHKTVIAAHIRAIAQVVVARNAQKRLTAPVDMFATQILEFVPLIQVFNGGLYYS